MPKDHDCTHFMTHEIVATIDAAKTNECVVFQFYVIAILIVHLIFDYYLPRL